MGPLFSLAVVLSVVLASGCVAYFFARALRISHPFLVALSFPVGAVLGGVACALLAAILLGLGAPLASSSQVMGYFTFLGVGSFVSGVFAAWCCKRVLTFSSTGRATPASWHHVGPPND